MNPLYQSAIDGTLKSPKSTEKITQIQIYNDLDVPIFIRLVDEDGNLTPAYPISAHGGTNLREIFKGWYAVFTVCHTGAFACVIEFTGATSYRINGSLLVDPNDVGRFPIPSKDILIPSDSARILVGCGLAPNGNPMTREQFWKRSPDSYTLAPGEKRTIGYTTTSGMQTTTSVEQEVATSLGLNASAGWGPISASVSASLSTTSRSMQQVAVSTETTRYETVELSNQDAAPKLFLRWQLMEVLTVFSKEPEIRPITAIVQAVLPTLIGGPYQLSPLGDQLVSADRPA
jgi:hypothetical protein